MTSPTHRVRVLAVGTLAVSSSATPRQRLQEMAQRVFTRFAPALGLACLAVVQFDTAFRNWVLLATSMSWWSVVDVVRAILYGSFVLGAAVFLWTKRDSSVRDGRGLIVAASLLASFLLTAVSWFPAGPQLWVASPGWLEMSLGVTALGAALALAALMSLGSNFSIVPESRALVVSGPYRWLRHPMYFAELMMITGITLCGPRLTSFIAALTVVGLQVGRVRAEERLLRTSFPTGHSVFAAHTRYRLIPLVW